MLAINAAPGRELPPPPWPRLRPAVGLLIALGVIGYYGSKIGDEPTPQLVVNTDSVVDDGPIAEFVVESATPRDFQIVVRTGVCTTAEFEWEGEGSKGSDVFDRCVSAHILSPPASAQLEPDTDYAIAATFTSDEGRQSSFERTIRTTSD